MFYSLTFYFSGLLFSVIDKKRVLVFFMNDLIKVMHTLDQVPFILL